jgi:LysM repeat protein
MRTRIFPALFVLGLVLTTVAPVAAAADSSVARLPTWHHVSRGETLYSIGRLYNVNPIAIAQANGLWNPHRIYVGQWLRIPAGPPYPWRPECGSTYTVHYGDTLYRIGRLFGIRAWRIAAVNGIYDMNRIWAGQRLFIPCY